VTSPTITSKSSSSQWSLLMFLMRVLPRFGVFPSTVATLKPINFLPMVCP